MAPLSNMALWAKFGPTGHHFSPIRGDASCGCDASYASMDKPNLILNSAHVIDSGGMTASATRSLLQRLDRRCRERTPVEASVANLVYTRKLDDPASKIFLLVGIATWSCDPWYGLLARYSMQEGYGLRCESNFGD